MDAFDFEDQPAAQHDDADNSQFDGANGDDPFIVAANEQEEHGDSGYQPPAIDHDQQQYDFAGDELDAPSKEHEEEEVKTPASASKPQGPRVNSNPFALGDGDDDSKFRDWQQQRTQLLESRRTSAEQAKHKQKKDAKEEIDGWYQIRTNTIKQSKNGNRAAEKEFLEKQRELKERGAPWERVISMVDLTPKPHESRDVSRIRHLLLQLKNDPNFNRPDAKAF